MRKVKRKVDVSISSVRNNTGRVSNHSAAKSRSAVSAKQEFLPLGSSMQGHATSKSITKLQQATRKPKNDESPGAHLYKFPSMSQMSKINHFSPLQVSPEKESPKREATSEKSDNSLVNTSIKIEIKQFAPDGTPDKDQSLEKDAPSPSPVVEDSPNKSKQSEKLLQLKLEK